MLRITKHCAPDDRLVLKLEGRFHGDWVSEVDRCWHSATEARPDASIWLDLTDVWFVDPAGQALLAKMHRAGVQFLTRGCLMRELVGEISES